jgi:hypothetical protein
MKRPSVPKCLEGLRKSSGKLYSSLAVFYVEQVALNRHVKCDRIAIDSPQPQLFFLCLKTKEMSRGNSENARYAQEIWENM